MVNSIYWLNKPYEGSENSLGYSIHTKKMYWNTRKYFDIEDPWSEWHLQIAPADQVHFSQGKNNIIFSMWEFPEVPENYKENLGKADIVLVPCHFCKEIFEPYTRQKPIVVWEGVDPKEFPYYQRKEPNYAKGERFRIFWSGARNTRKGYQHITDLIRLLGNRTDIEIYMKTHADLPSDEEMKERLKEYPELDAQRYIDTFISTKHVRVVGKNKNIYLDMRKVSFEELKALYNSAHVFVFPTHGEGWGLIGTEMLSTGCPVIANPVTGVKEWFDNQVGYTLTYHERQIEATNYGNMLVTTYEPDLQSIIDRVFEVKNNYKEALRRGKRGADRMKKKFTWDMAGQRLARVLEKL
jgi:glycosyltransferase involved in cell wall biosynthesis